MGKARIDHSGAHNGIRSRKGRRCMPYGDLEAEIAHHSLKVVAYTADATVARERYDACVAEHMAAAFTGEPPLPVHEVTASAVQAAFFAMRDARNMHMMLVREKARRDTSRRKLRKIGDISRPLS